MLIILMAKAEPENSRMQTKVSLNTFDQPLSQPESGLSYR